MMENYLPALLHLLMPPTLRTKFRGGGVLKSNKENQSQIAFSGWKEWASELDKLHQQASYLIDVPDNTDLAEFMKTAEYNVIYRVRSNRNIQNTCVPNTQYSFYVLEGTFIAGYNHNANSKYLCNFVNRIFTRWERVLTQNYSLESLGLSDEDFSDNDFVSNLLLISETIGNVECNFSVYVEKYDGSGTTNLWHSLIEQLKKDGFDYSGLNNPFFQLSINRLANRAAPIKVELILDGVGSDRNLTIVGYANKDNGVMYFYGFHKLAAVQKTSELALLNGWKNHSNYRKVTAVKVGDIVTVTGMIYKEVPPTVGETVLILPTEYRPKGATIQVSFIGSVDNLSYADITPDGAIVMYRYQSGVLFFNFSYGI